MMNKHESTPLPQNLLTESTKKPHRHKAKRVIKIALAVFFGIIMLSILADFFVGVHNATYQYLHISDYFAVRSELQHSAAYFRQVYDEKANGLAGAMSGNGGLTLYFDSDFQSFSVEPGATQENSIAIADPDITAALRAINERMLAHQYVMLAILTDKPRSPALNMVMVDETEVMFWFGYPCGWDIERPFYNRGSGFSLVTDGSQPHLYHGESGGTLGFVDGWHWVKQFDDRRWTWTYFHGDCAQVLFWVVILPFDLLFTGISTAISKISN